MAEQLAVENGEKLQKVQSYLVKRNSILPGQMAEQLSVEVDVKNVTHRHTDRRNTPFICLDGILY